MIDHKQKQIRKAESEGRQFLADKISKEEAKAGAAQGKWPAGSVWLWCAECVYGPVKKKGQAA